METRILPALDQFRPDLILVSAGFDAHMRDPLAQLLADRGGDLGTARDRELVEQMLADLEIPVATQVLGAAVEIDKKLDAVANVMASRTS